MYVRPSNSFTLADRVAINARFTLRHFALNSTTLGHRYRHTRASYYPEGRIDSSTELVIDGFPRSGNSYARFAFAIAQGGPFYPGLRGHAHSSQLVREAVRSRIPTVVLVRNPADAIASLLQMEPLVTLRVAARAYHSYYSAIERTLPSALVVDFERVVTDMGGVINRVNTMFGTSFKPYVKTPENEAAIMQLLDESDARFSGGRTREMSVARPSLSRLSSSVLRQQWGEKDLRAIHQCQALFSRLCGMGRVS